MGEVMGKMIGETEKIGGRCSCGSFAFEVTGKPLFRAYCHCTICQKFNNADYSDVTVFYAKNVDLYGT